VAIENGVKTIAFPEISTGVYRYPKNQACKIALNTTADFLNEHREIERVIFVCFSHGDYKMYQEAISKMQA